MKLAIVEPQANGHYMVLYARHVAREAIRRGWQVQLVTTRSSLTHPALEILQTDCDRRVEVLAMPDLPAGGGGRGALVRQQWQRYRAFRNVHRSQWAKHAPDAIFVPSLDHIDKVAALCGSPFADIPFSGFYLSATFHHSAMGIAGRPRRLARLYESLFIRFLRLPSMSRLFASDEALAQYVRSRHARYARKIQYVPELVTQGSVATRADARTRWDIAAANYVILAYGVLSRRKGIVQLLRSACHADVDRNTVILLAGSLDAEVRQYLQTAPEAVMLRNAGRLRVIDKFLSDDEARAAFQAADVVWVGYIGFYGMSGVLAQAASAGIPVIACREGLLGWVCRKYGWGEAVDVTDDRQVVDAILRLQRDEAGRRRLANEAPAVAEKHAPSRFAQQLCDGMASHG